MEICGRTVPAVNTGDGIRATKKGDPIDPDGVEQYLQKKFGDDLERVDETLQMLADAHRPKELADAAYPLYERFRPGIPAGKKGWGAKGDLDLALIRRLARKEE